MAAPLPDPGKLDKELTRLRQNGLVLPRHPERAAQAYGDSFVTNAALGSAAERDLHQMGTRLGRTITDANYGTPEVQRLMAENKAITRVMGERRGITASGRISKEARRKSQDERWYGGLSKQAVMGGGGTAMGGDVFNAIPRFYDPLEYWDLSGLPWNVADEGHRHKLHKWMRLYYATHYLVPILVDIFTRFPLVGMELEGKDPALIEIYEDIFLNQLNYEDFLVSLGREYWLCALPGEIVQTASSTQAIEDIQVGDQVLTDQGRLQPVTRLIRSEYEGEYVELRPHYGLPMRYTSGHRFLTRRYGNQVNWLPIEKIKTTDEVFVPVDQREVDCPYFSVWETLSREEWCPVPTDEEVDTWKIPEHVRWTTSVAKYRSYTKRHIRKVWDAGYPPGSVWKRNAKYAQHSPLYERVFVDEDFLWFVGIYLAEGSVSKDGVIIDLHEDEIDYAERVLAYADVLGLNAVMKPVGEHGLRVIVYSIAFGAFIQSLLGTGWYGKAIPEWMMILPPHKQATLLRGYFDGDGCYHDVRVKATSGSQRLALQVERMIRRLGVVTTINRSTSITDHGTHCEWFDVGPCLADTNKFMDALGFEATYPERQRAYAHWDDHGYWVKVLRVTHGHYEGPVYNFEVETDHSYVGSVATHNCGESYPLGSFDEDLGIWEHEELINPEDVVIDNFPLLGTQQLKIVPPDYLRRIAQTQSPAREWYMLQEQYEDLIPYLLKGEHIPMSPVMLRQVANKMNDWDDHGTPILMRGLRTLLHEEKLLASQDAIAERLYSPFILAKLGIMDMGDGLPPWIPGPDELQSVRDDLDIAMASDFRVMVHHFGLEMESVFGREQMPRLGDDFDRIERRLMQVFGVNPSLLSAGSNSQPYASSALQAEFMNQILRTFQKMLKYHFKQRAMVVAEAQEHYDYERKGQTRVPIYETVVEWDDDGNKKLVRKPKLLVPDLTFATFDLRDEATERQFLMSLREAGVPIPDEKLMVGVSWKRDDYIEEYNRDVMHKTISQQRAKMDTYIACVIQGLPVPMDLKYEVESVLMGGTGPSGMPGGAGQGGGPEAGALGGPPGAPQHGGGEGIPMPAAPPGLLGPQGGEAPPGGGPPPTGPNQGGPPGNVPPVSNERRQGLQYNTPFKSSVEHQASDKELAAFTEQWPEEMRKRAVAIRDSLELSGGFVPGALDDPEIHTSSDTVEETETEDPGTWVLRGNQKLEDHDGQPVIVQSSRKRVNLPIEPGKRYSVIDPLADPLEELDDIAPTEPARPGRDN